MCPHDSPPPQGLKRLDAGAEEVSRACVTPLCCSDEPVGRRAAARGHRAVPGQARGRVPHRRALGLPRLGAAHRLQQGPAPCFTHWLVHVSVYPSVDSCPAYHLDATASHQRTTELVQVGSLSGGSPESCAVASAGHQAVRDALQEDRLRGGARLHHGHLPRRQVMLQPTVHLQAGPATHPALSPLHLPYCPPLPFLHPGDQGAVCMPCAG
jgi:hypothetical protein